MSEIQAETYKAIVFRLNEHEYSIPVQHAKSIEKIKQITRVPNVPPYIKGVINLRGSIIPMLDLKARLGIGTAEFSDHTRAIICQVGSIEAGLIVDSANDVVDIPCEPGEMQAAAGEEVHEDYVAGVVKLGDRLLILVDIEQVLSHEAAGETANGL
ncbi:MAG TPA: chemotaxis protein CheW [Bacillaceae bacterium]